MAETALLLPDQLIPYGVTKREAIRICDSYNNGNTASQKITVVSPEGTARATWFLRMGTASIVGAASVSGSLILDSLMGDIVGTAALVSSGVLMTVAGLWKGGKARMTRIETAPLTVGRGQISRDALHASRLSPEVLGVPRDEFYRRVISLRDFYQDQDELKRAGSTQEAEEHAAKFHEDRKWLREKADLYRKA